jgi:hypothetical protein
MAGRGGFEPTIPKRSLDYVIGFRALNKKLWLLVCELRYKVLGAKPLDEVQRNVALRKVLSVEEGRRYRAEVWILESPILTSVFFHKLTLALPRLRHVIDETLLSRRHTDGRLCAHRARFVPARPTPTSFGFEVGFEMNAPA